MTKRSNNGTVYDLIGPEEGDVIVLIHGLGLRRETWSEHLPALSKHYRVLSYDLYGHGETVQPPETPSLKLFANQLAELMQELSISSAHISGFSLGGMINRRLAMDSSNLVSSLIILNSPHERGEEAQKLVEERAAQTGTGGPGATLDATIERWFTADYIASHPTEIQMVRDWVLANNADTYALCRQVLAHGVKELIRPTPAITKPTLLITCEDDSGSTPAMSHGIASEIDGAQTIIVPNLQHMGLMERPELFTGPTLKFLNTLNSQGRTNG
jgi:(E)-2-((N-methylformamido)methylene)succinate hydrolase